METKVCAICEKPIEGKIRTAVPVKKEGYACDECYVKVVRPRVQNLIDAIMTGVLPYEK